MSQLHNNRFFSVAATAIICLFAVPLATAQEGSEDVIEVQMAVDDDTGAGPIVISSSRMAFSGDSPDGEPTFEVFTGGEILGDFMPSSAGAIDPLSLLSNAGVRDELVLVGDQLEKFQKAQKELKEKIREKAKALKSGELDPAAIGDLAKEIGAMQKARQQQMEEFLLPHQLKRLKELALQIQMKRRGAASTLVSRNMAEELGIDADQKKRIQDREKELKKELAEKMEKLKQEMRDKLLAELTSDQRAKLKEMSGDSFDYKPTNINERIQRQIRKQRERSGS